MKRVRSLKEVHLSREEMFCLVVAIGLLGWAAYVEAWKLCISQAISDCGSWWRRF
jgi:hypothetical protein